MHNCVYRKGCRAWQKGLELRLCTLMLHRFVCVLVGHDCPEVNVVLDCPGVHGTLQDRKWVLMMTEFHFRPRSAADEQEF